MLLFPPSLSYLVLLNLTCMREVKLIREDVEKLTDVSLFVNVVGDHLSDQVLPCAGGSVQRQHQGLFGVGVFHESSHSLEDDGRGDVLSHQLVFQVRPET